MEAKRNNVSECPTPRKRTKEKLQDALIRLSGAQCPLEVSVAELCREAGVSRSSFYLNYNHIKEVYDDVVKSLVEAIQPFQEHVGCRECMDKNKTPFCDFIRLNKEYRGIFFDRQFLETYMEIAFNDSSYDYLAYLAERGLGRREAELLFRFHLSGCYAVATSHFAQEPDFDQQRRMLDKFIRAGHDVVCPRL